MKIRAFIILLIILLLPLYLLIRNNGRPKNEVSNNKKHKVVTSVNDRLLFKREIKLIATKIRAQQKKNEQHAKYMVAKKREEDYLKLERKIFITIKKVNEQDQENLDETRYELRKLMQKDREDAKRLILGLKNKLAKLSTEEVFIVLESFIETQIDSVPTLVKFLSQRITEEPFEINEHHMITSSQKMTMASAYILDKISTKSKKLGIETEDLRPLLPLLIKNAKHENDLMLVRSSLEKLKELFDYSSDQLKKIVTGRNSNELFAYSDLLETSDGR